MNLLEASGTHDVDAPAHRSGRTGTETAVLRSLLPTDLPDLYQHLPAGRGNLLLTSGVIPTPDGFGRMFADPAVATVLVIEHNRAAVGALVVANISGASSHAQVSAIIAPGVPIGLLAPAAAGFVNHVFDRLPLNKLCLSGPEPVFRELQELFGPSLREEGRLLGHWFMDGAYCDSMVGSILRREWHAVPPRSGDGSDG